jgi:hypothetical protein
MVTLFLQLHLDYTPLQAAWILMPSAVVLGILSVGTGRLSDLVPARLLVICGLSGVSLCLFQHTTITPLTSIGAITFWFAMRGVARAFTIAPVTAVSLASLPESDIRMGSGLLSLNRGIASAGSVALATTVFQNRIAERTLWLAQEQSALPFGAAELLQSLHIFFERLGDFAQVAEAKAFATLQQLIDAEAALHSYHDMFIIIGCISAAGILPALWMGKRRTAEAAHPIAPQPGVTPESPSGAPFSPSVETQNGIQAGTITEAEGERERETRG